MVPPISAVNTSALRGALRDDGIVGDAEAVRQVAEQKCHNGGNGENTADYDEADFCNGASHDE